MPDITNETELNRPPRKARRRWWRWFLLIIIIFITVGVWVAWRNAEALINQLGQPYLVKAGLPEARIGLKGLSLEGATFELYLSAVDVEPALAITLPFDTLRAEKLRITSASLRFLTGSSSPAPLPDPMALLRLPLPLDRLPWSEIEVQQWAITEPIAATGTASFTKAAEGYVLKGEALLANLGILTNLRITGEASGGHSKAKALATITASGQVSSHPLSGLETTLNCQKQCNVRGQGRIAEQPFTFTANGGLNALDIHFSLPEAAFVGLPVSKVEAKLKWTPSEVKVRTASASLFGGILTLAPLAIRLPFDSMAGAISASSLNLADILALAQLDGLSGNGRLSGKLPFWWRSAALTLTNAELITSSPGQLAYAPAEPPSFMAEGGQGALLAEVFRNFYYSALKFSLNGTLGQDLQLTARVEGKNPDFYSGHAVAFNLNLSGALDTMLRQGLATGNLSAEGISELMKMEGNPK